MSLTIDKSGMLHDTTGKFAGSVNGSCVQYDLFGNEHKEETSKVVNRKAMTMFKAGAAVGAAMFLVACASPADANDNYDLFTAAGSSTSSSYNEDDYISGGDREGSTGNGLDPDDSDDLSVDLRVEFDYAVSSINTFDENLSQDENIALWVEEHNRIVSEFISRLQPGHTLSIDENIVAIIRQQIIDNGGDPDSGNYVIPPSTLVREAQVAGVVFYHTDQGSTVIDPNDPPQFVIDAYTRQLQALARGENVPFHPREMDGSYRDPQGNPRSTAPLPVVLISGSRNTTTDRSSGIIMVDPSLPANTAQQIKDMGQVAFARANPNVIVITEQGRVQ